MEKELHAYRKSYQKKELSIADISDDPKVLFKRWFDEVDQSNLIEEVNAMTLLTIGTDGFPKGRVVLLKEITSQGFVFYTNYQSEKGRSIEKEPKVGINFFWPELERQVIIKGIASRVPEEQSNNYFAARPKGSQLGAWTSDQSRVIAGREVLDNKLRELEKEFENKPVPRPEHWGGYCIEPISYEFWQGRPNRLHDRIIYTKNKDNWQTARLAP